MVDSKSSWSTNVDENVEPSSSQISPCSTNTVAVESPTSVMGVSSDSDRACFVCGDKASGYHYGAWSCEGCKAFFKRSVQGNAQYLCPATNQCTIDKSRRRSCQACRLRRCQEVGMQSSGIKKDSRKQAKRLKQSNDNDSVSTVQRMCELLHSIEPLTLRADLQEDHFTPLTEISILKCLAKLADRQLILIIEWAKNIPGYMQLKLSTQVHLLESSWFDIILISLCYFSKECKSDQIQFAPDLILTKSALIEANHNKISSLHEDIFALCNKFRNIDVSPLEFSVLKALILVHSVSEVSLVSDGDRLASLQNTTSDCLNYSVKKFCETRSLKPHRRHVTLLMLCSQVKRLSCHIVDYLFHLNCSAPPLFENLFGDTV